MNFHVMEWMRALTEPAAPPPFAVTGPHDAAMRTRDGVRLDADLYRPDAPGDFPVLLMRQPYGRRIASTVVYAHPAWYAAHGYIVVIQDVRGRGTSQGRFRIFADDRDDGQDSLAWAAGLPGSTGLVGMYGFSYQGVTQLLALASSAPALAALCPAMMPWNIRADWAYEGDAFCLSGNLGWAVQMATEQARLGNDPAAHAALFAASRALPLHSPTPCRPPIFDLLAKYGHYADWLENPAPGAYWDAISPDAALDGVPVDVPMLHIGGWYDSFLPGTLSCFAAMQARSQAPQRLVVGPWTHNPWGRQVGAVDFGPYAAGGMDRLQLAWFDRFLKHMENGAETGPAMQLFDLSAKTWRGHDHFAPATRFYTASDGLAATTESGALRAGPALPATDHFVHDPWRPMPALGGHNAQPGGMQNRAALDSRSETLCYTTPVLDQAILLGGAVTAQLRIGADTRSFDISATLSWLPGDGRVLNLTQGFRRVLQPPEAGLVEVQMRAVCAEIPAGSALRLSIAAACFPAFANNPGTGAADAQATLMEAVPITITLRSGGADGSFLELPIISSAAGSRETAGARSAPPVDTKPG